MSKRNILKGAVVLLITVALFFSSSAVTADTVNGIKKVNRQIYTADICNEAGYNSIEYEPITYSTNNNGPIIFSQQPVPDDSSAHGPYSDDGLTYRVYDNFWGLTKDIRDVHWWGLWSGSGPIPGDTFEISFCADNAGEPNYNNHLYDFTGSLGTEITYVGTGNFYWGHELYYMEMDLPITVSMASGWVSFYKTNINSQYFAMIDALTGDGKFYHLNGGGIRDFDVAFELTTEELPPSAPFITGPSQGDPNDPQTFKFQASDPDSSNVRYHINWDDGTPMETTGYFPVGTQADVIHTYTQSGKYTITAYAEDEEGNSGPSSTFLFTCPRDKSTYNINLLSLFEKFPLLQKLIQQLGL